MGLTALGEAAIDGIIDRGMIFDPDHMSVLARNKALDIVEQRDYPGVMTSHSWSTDNALPRISALGGLIGPDGRAPRRGSSTSGTTSGRTATTRSNPYGFGLGYGADMNGFASQGGPRTPHGRGPGGQLPVPVASTAPRRSTSRCPGERTFDINVDGVAHYGLFPDWVEDVRILGGQAIVDDMADGAEAYLQMWERATGDQPERRLRDVADPAGKSGGNAAKKQKCAKLRAKLKRAKSKQAKRKLRKKLRKKGC